MRSLLSLPPQTVVPLIHAGVYEKLQAVVQSQPLLVLAPSTGVP
jgi:hypothetical protein